MTRDRRHARVSPNFPQKLTYTHLLQRSSRQQLSSCFGLFWATNEEQELGDFGPGPD